MVLTLPTVWEGFERCPPADRFRALYERPGGRSTAALPLERPDPRRPGQYKYFDWYHKKQ